MLSKLLKRAIKKVKWATIHKLSKVILKVKEKLPQVDSSIFLKIMLKKVIKEQKQMK
jgi:hypothetical protein